MSIYVGKDKATLFHGDHHPASFYKGDKLIAGFETPTLTGKDQISFQSPYKANMDSVKSYGVGKQEGTPNPDYPIEPKFYPGGELEVRGKNLLDLTKADLTGGGLSFKGQDLLVNIPSNKTSWYISYPLNVLPGTYTVSVSTDIPKQKYQTLIFIRKADGSQIFTYSPFRINVGEIIDSIQVRFKESPELITGIANIQLEQSPTPTPYEPYYPPQLAQIPILRALPDGSVRDEYDVRTGVLTRRIGVKEFDGSEYWTLTSNSQAYFATDGESVLADNDRAVVLSDRFTGIPFNGSWAGKSNFVVSGYSSIRFDYPKLTTLNEWREFLASNPVTVWYALKTPIIEHLPPKLLTQHPGYTILTQEPNLVPIKKTVEGQVIAVDDVSETAHEVECKVESKNLVDLTTGSNILFSFNQKTGVVSTTEQLTENSYLWVYGPLPAAVHPNTELIMPKDGVITISDKFVTSDVGSVELYVNQVEIGAVTSGRSIQTIVNKGDRVGIVCINNADAPARENAFAPMLEYAEAPSIFTPYIPDLSQVVVSRFGKNFFNAYGIPCASGEFSKNFPCEPITTNSMTVGGIAGSSEGGSIAIPCYGLSHIAVRMIVETSDNNPSYQVNIGECLDVVDGIMISRISDNLYDRLGAVEFVYTFKNPSSRFFYIGGVANKGQTVTLKDIQVTADNKITPFVASTPQTLTPLPSGEVSGMTSLSPNMTILTDNPGAVITATYDTNQNEETIYADMSAKVYKER